MRILYHPRKLARVKYGLLYNWYAATDVRNIAASGWHVPTFTELQNLMLYLDPDGVGDDNDAAGYLKETGITHWNDPNTGATDDYEFSLYGTGGRDGNDGLFGDINLGTTLWSSTDIGVGGATASSFYDSVLFYMSDPPGSLVGNTYSTGNPIRLIKDDSTLEHYTGNDGKEYRTVKIGTQVWMAENLAETEYRNGNAIPEVIDNSAWISLTSGALCAYNNDWGNV